MGQRGAVAAGGPGDVDVGAGRGAGGYLVQVGEVCDPDPGRGVMNGRIVFLTVLAASAFVVAPMPVAAQADVRVSAASPLAIGETFTIESRVLGETRRINVYVPSVYGAPADARYPVLYMPDGGIGEDFLHVAGLVQVLVGNGGMRPFMVVGIENTARRRDLTGPTRNAEDGTIAPVVGGSEAFRRFIATELKPVIATRYRTTEESAIVGESLAGLFVVETLVLEPSLFDTYIAIDPSVWWDSGSLVERIAPAFASRKNASLWVARSGDGDRGDHLSRLAELMRAAGSRWHFEAMPEETHATIYHPAALRAFRTLFTPARAGG